MVSTVPSRRAEAMKSCLLWRKNSACVFASRRLCGLAVRESNQAWKVYSGMLEYRSSRGDQLDASNGKHMSTKGLYLAVAGSLHMYIHRPNYPVHLKSKATKMWTSWSRLSPHYGPFPVFQVRIVKFALARSRPSADGNGTTITPTTREQ
ncbi:hypothetical protein BO82DRAFT_82316 [Aspergillus uvarum CBS 121591]|uniref:Uncharacterized protein n=1 Tax=Aspergillus uvarum CBS 121591 TaxID=1448315 RepID=A0A319C879_9EURO|nr:hypothetical protein BO82DRAFT_82316 [Aspergillus uvarum CBS 121591]PYH81605.1 hypothetical protein BO82DRAFT_82316 [Aspergillus uvarum CBS 121591]